MPESEFFEEKSTFEWGLEGQQYDLLKTIIAFANTEGGTIQIKAVVGDKDRLDFARLDDFCNKHISPRIGGIVGEFIEGNGCLVTVAKSSFAPHVVAQEASYQKKVS